MKYLIVSFLSFAFLSALSAIAWLVLPETIADDENQTAVAALFTGISVAGLLTTVFFQAWISNKNSQDQLEAQRQAMEQTAAQKASLDLARASLVLQSNQILLDRVSQRIESEERAIFQDRVEILMALDQSAKGIEKELKRIKIPVTDLERRDNESMNDYIMRLFAGETVRLIDILVAEKEASSLPIEAKKDFAFSDWLLAVRGLVLDFSVEKAKLNDIERRTNQLSDLTLIQTNLMNSVAIQSAEIQSSELSAIPDSQIAAIKAAFPELFTKETASKDSKH